jgi:hypothetical protein
LGRGNDRFDYRRSDRCCRPVRMSNRGHME